MRGDIAERALLRSLIGGRRDAVADGLSDRLSEFGERGGDPQRWRSFGGDFVVTAAQILQEREAGDDHLRGAVVLAENLVPAGHDCWSSHERVACRGSDRR